MTRDLHVLMRLALASLVWLPLASKVRAQEATGPDSMSIKVKAGRHDRQDTPVRFELPEDRLGPAVRKALDDGPVALPLVAKSKMLQGGLAQLDRDPAGPLVRVTFILNGHLAEEDEARYLLEVDHPVPPFIPVNQAPPFSFDQSTPGSLYLRHGGLRRPVFRYNAAPVSSPNYGPIQVRDAYIHPAYTPNGSLITGDFSSSHPHHRGFFLAYEKTKTGDLTPDFWNIHLGTGKIHADGLDRPIVGAVTARFSAKHRWEAKDKATGKGTVFLRERWEVETYDIPGSPYWLFDVTSTQQAVDRPLELLPYRYGGMAYRGPEPFVKGTLDVLTSEGLHRKDGDQKPARWVDLTGPIADGSDQYAGAMIADHPSNPHYPNVARIHPTTLPFFCYVPSHDKPLTIAVDTPSVFRYRVLIHDGKPDSKLDERVACDFAEPPVVVVE